MITASVRIRLPEDSWVSELSRAFPSATFRLLAGVETGETAIELGEIVAENPLEVSETVAAHPSIVAHERLEVTDDRSLSKYETTDTDLYVFVEATSLPPEFPIVVRNGWYELDFTGTRAEFDQLRDLLERASLRYELQSLVEADQSNGLLTDRQREVLKTALWEGYFEVPRECTLQELAATLDVDKATASGVIRRGEARVLKWFLTGSHSTRPESTPADD